MSAYTELDAAKNEQEQIKASAAALYRGIEALVVMFAKAHGLNPSDPDLCGDFKSAVDYLAEEASADAWTRQCEAEREIEAIEASAERLRSPVVL